jgi:predicted PurR-regulated permease PerM
MDAEGGGGDGAQFVRGSRGSPPQLRQRRGIGHRPAESTAFGLGPALAWLSRMVPVADDRSARRFFVLLLAATTLVLALVIRPLASALFMAAVLGGVLAPLHASLSATLRGRSRLAAGILVAAVFVVLVGPVVALAAFLLKEGNEALKFVAVAVRSDSVSQLVAKLPDSLAKIVGHALSGLLDVDRVVEGQLSAQGGKAAAAVWGALSATGSVIFASA